MANEFLNGDILIGGYDTGNNKLKVSFLDGTQNIQSFAIPTVIAIAPQTKVDLKSSNKETAEEDVDFLHVRVSSKSLNNTDNDKAWYVGTYAKSQDEKFEPVVNSEGKTEDKLSQANKKLHLIPLFTGMAVAALRSGKNKVQVPFSGGVPIEDYKTRGEAQILEMLFGKHVITFLDGDYEGQTVELEINDGSINVEGVHSVLALEFDIQNGEIVEVETGKEIGENFAINDLGAGTTDKALFENGILNKVKSTNNDIGTNKYIDDILKEIRNHSKFDQIRKYFTKETDSPYKTREEFIQNLVAPEMLKVINADKNKQSYEPKFITKWGPVKNVDVTDIVLNGMNEYAKAQEQDLMHFWLDTGTDKMIVVGGGVLFGYLGLRELQAHDGFIFPKNIEESSYFTSRSYLIANYLEQLEKSEAVKN